MDRTRYFSGRRILGETMHAVIFLVEGGVSRPIIPTQAFGGLVMFCLWSECPYFQIKLSMPLSSEHSWLKDNSLQQYILSGKEKGGDPFPLPLRPTCLLSSPSLSSTTPHCFSITARPHTFPLQCSGAYISMHPLKSSISSIVGHSIKHV